ncbi:MAG TPA: hypothetical protein VMT58_07675 [Candidatus Binataceae bacterium]|nr:hypothetical protein [Candidatus Binataceae bacterium]
MNTRQRMISALAGFAMLAIPVAASAHDYRRDPGFKPRAVHEYRVNRRERRLFRPAIVNRAPVWPQNDPYPGYNGWAANPPVALAAPGYQNGCEKAQRIMNQVAYDRRTGHTAAAQELLRKHRGEIRACNESYGLNTGFGAAPVLSSYQTPYAANPYAYGNSSVLTPLIQQFIQ